MKENSYLTTINSDFNNVRTSPRQSPNNSVKETKPEIGVKVLSKDKSGLSSLSVLTALLETASNISSTVKSESVSAPSNVSNRIHREGNNNNNGKNRYDSQRNLVNRNYEDYRGTGYKKNNNNNLGRWKSAGYNINNQGLNKCPVVSSSKTDLKNDLINPRYNLLSVSNEKDTNHSLDSNNSHQEEMPSVFGKYKGSGSNLPANKVNSSHEEQPITKIVSINESEPNVSNNKAVDIIHRQPKTNENGETPVIKTWSQSRISIPLSSHDQMCRDIKCSLNKLTVENFPVLAEHVCSLCVNISNSKELCKVVELVLDKTFSESEFSELYADLCLVMSYWTPCFTDYIDNDNSRPQQVSFSSLVIKKWVDEFNKLPEFFELTEEQKKTLSVEDQEIEINMLKKKLKGLCVSFGEFVIRKIIGMRGFGIASSALIGDENPKEHLVEGAYFDSDPVGRLLLENCFGKLQELVTCERFSKRIRCIIQDLIDIRKVDWHRKTHKERAKGLSKLKEDMENADFLGGSAVRAQYGFVVQLGQRNNILDNVDYANFMENQYKLYKQRLNLN